MRITINLMIEIRMLEWILREGGYDVCAYEW